MIHSLVQYMFPDVVLVMTREGEPLTTRVTHIGIDPGVATLVFKQRVLAGINFVTFITFVRFIVTMFLNVLLQVATEQELLGTQLTREPVGAVVPHHVGAVGGDVT